MADNWKKFSSLFKEPLIEEETGEELWYVERILSKKIITKNRKRIPFYLVKWEGWPSKYNTWEPIHNLEECMNLINEYEDEINWKKQNTSEKSKKIRKNSINSEKSNLKSNECRNEENSKITTKEEYGQTIQNENNNNKGILERKLSEKQEIKNLESKENQKPTENQESSESDEKENMGIESIVEVDNHIKSMKEEITFDKIGKEVNLEIDECKTPIPSIVEEKIIQNQINEDEIPSSNSKFNIPSNLEDKEKHPETIKYEKFSIDESLNPYVCLKCSDVIHDQTLDTFDKNTSIEDNKRLKFPLKLEKCSQTFLTSLPDQKSESSYTYSSEISQKSDNQGLSRESNKALELLERVQARIKADILSSKSREASRKFNFIEDIGEGEKSQKKRKPSNMKGFYEIEEN